MYSCIVGAGDAELRRAGEHLRAGCLVSFPTETVYGLGADATNEAAARRIFAVKGRPPTDPLIVHVTDAAAVSTLWDEAPEVLALGRALGAALWPGPLTLVARASSVVAPSVTGGSGMVGVRVPAHPVARALIDAAGLPIAAPSANTFGHVSPTTAVHVATDLAARDPTLLIVDGGCCPVGIESTVVRLMSAHRLEILRRGAVNEHDLRRAIPDPAVEIVVRDTRTNAKKIEEAEAADAAPMDAPGQLLTHYSPSVPAFLVAPSSFATAASSSSSTTINAPWSLGAVAAGALAASVHARPATVILDFGGAIAASFRRAFGVDPAVLATTATTAGPSPPVGAPPAAAVGGRIIAYRDLSPTGAAEEASRAVFDALRWTETIAGAEVVLLPLIVPFLMQQQEQQRSAESVALCEAVEDRLFRAASGRVVTIDPVSS